MEMEMECALIRVALLGLNSEGAKGHLAYSLINDSCPKFMCCYLFRMVAEFKGDCNFEGTISMAHSGTYDTLL